MHLLHGLMLSIFFTNIMLLYFLSDKARRQTSGCREVTVGSKDIQSKGRKAPRRIRFHAIPDFIINAYI